MTKPDSDALAPLVVAAAVASAGENGGPGWRNKVLGNIPEIASMMSDRSKEYDLAMKVLEAPVIFGYYMGHEVEASSTRAVVTFFTGKESRNAPEGIETIRTHRTDTALGKAMVAKLDRLTDGDRILLWKAMDEMPDGNKARLLVHLRFVGHDDREQKPRQAPRQQAAKKSAPTDDDVAFAVERFEELSTKDQVAVRRAARAKGVAYPTDDPSSVDAFLSVIDETIR